MDRVWQQPGVRYVAIATAIAYLLYLAVMRPYMFGVRNMTIALGLVVFAFLSIGFERYFLPVLLLIFFWAGSAVPFAGTMQFVRWVALGLGAFLSIVHYVRRAYRLPFNHFHLFGLLTVVAALVSATASYNPRLTLLKAGSVAALFFYASIGIRSVWYERPDRVVCAITWLAWILVYLTAVLYFVFSFEIWGNPNSLGVVVSVLCWPILLWRYLLAENLRERIRAGIPLFLSAVLLASSGARASLLAGATTACVLLISARRYRMLIAGTFLTCAVLVAAYILSPAHFNREAEHVIYKKGQRYQGVLFSRQATWQTSWDSVKKHPWLGTGFGVSEVAVDWRGGYESSYDSRERGSSYLTLLEGFGIVGGVPLAVILASFCYSFWRTFSWLRRGARILHPAVPVACMLCAGLVNAAFEDWLLAVGYHTTVLFWVLAFSMHDLTAASAVSKRCSGMRHSGNIWSAAAG